MKFNLPKIFIFCMLAFTLSAFGENEQQTVTENYSPQIEAEQTVTPKQTIFDEQPSSDEQTLSEEQSEEIQAQQKSYSDIINDDELLEEAYQRAQEQAQFNDVIPKKWEIKNAKKEQKANKPKDPRPLGTKAREKLHLPKGKKIYYYNLDLSKQPKFNDDYIKMAQDIKRSDFKIPEPIYEKDPKFVVPDPQYRVVFYNSPPGMRKMELKNLYINNKIDSQAILSPDKSKLVYTSVYYYPSWHQTGYDAHYVNIKPGTSVKNALKNSYITQQEMKPIISSLNDPLNEYKLATLFPLDWSKDSSKIAFKEQVGSTLDGVWETNVIVYDFNTDTYNRLDTLREAVEYYWKKYFGIDLNNYMWDLYPVGWSADDDNRIVFYAYAFSKKSKSYFLGTWSIDWEENVSRMISLDETSVPVSVNGFGLQLIELAH